MHQDAIGGNSSYSSNVDPPAALGAEQHASIGCADIWTADEGNGPAVITDGIVGTRALPRLRRVLASIRAEMLSRFSSGKQQR